MLRYGDTLSAVRPGDCISCPAGTGTAHQLANTGAEDLLYLAIGRNDPKEVCVYPDTGKVLIRGIKQLGFIQRADYMEGEPDEPRIFAMAEEQGAAR